MSEEGIGEGRLQILRYVTSNIDIRRQTKKQFKSIYLCVHIRATPLAHFSVRLTVISKFK